MDLIHLITSPINENINSKYMSIKHALLPFIYDEFAYN